MNVAVHYLRDLTPHKVPFAISLRVIAAVVVLVVVAFSAKSRQAKPKAASAVPTSTHSVSQQTSPRAEVLNLTLPRIESQTHDAKMLRFILPANQPIAPRPGQFLTFDWMIDSKTVKRSYTICSSPTQRNFVEITPKRVENGHVSKFLNDRASLGMTVKARGPYGKFHFDESKHERISC
jgi:NADPH-dependent ferric siderophore reductase